MELMLIIRISLRRWWLVLVPAIVAGVFVVPDFLNGAPAASGGFTTSIRYSAAQRFNLPERDGDYQDVWLASELTVNAFTEWVRNSRFRAELSLELDNMGYDIDPGLLGLAADNARSVGVIYLSYPTADELEQIANAVITVLASRNQDYFPQLGGEPAQVTLLDDVVIVPGAAPIANRFAPVIKLGLALIGGIMLAFLVDYFDPTLHSREELEAQGYRVLGTIPRHK